MQDRKLILSLLCCLTFMLIGSVALAFDSTNCEETVNNCAEKCPNDPASLPACQEFCRSLACNDNQKAPDNRPRDSRSDWVEGGNFQLDACTESQKDDCKEQCTRTFDKKPEVCLSECLEGLCFDGQTSDLSSEDSQELADLCAQFESQECKGKCQDSSGSEQLRCRRQCLMSACPSASQLVLAEEALNPGASKCKRCREEQSLTCRNLCGVPSIGRRIPGLAHSGCVELCERTKCDCW